MVRDNSQHKRRASPRKNKRSASKRRASPSKNKRRASPSKSKRGSSKRGSSKRGSSKRRQSKKYGRKTRKDGVSSLELLPRNKRVYLIINKVPELAHYDVYLGLFMDYIYENGIMMKLKFKILDKFIGPRDVTKGKIMDFDIDDSIFIHVPQYSIEELTDDDYDKLTGDDIRLLRKQQDISIGDRIRYDYLDDI